MKLKFLFLLFWLFAGQFLKEMKAQHLSIRLYNGTENTEELSAVQKLSFQDGNLLLTRKSGSADTYALATVRKLYFDMQTSLVEIGPGKYNGITLFPDPAYNLITLGNIPDGLVQVNIYSVDGKLLLKTGVSDDNKTINVSNLQPGLYLLKAGSHTAKFIKL
jgi:hypothetical protein